jgi:hypothetical protein
MSLYGPLSSVGSSTRSLGKVLCYIRIFLNSRVRLDWFANFAEVQRCASIYIHAIAKA